MNLKDLETRLRSLIEIELLALLPGTNLEEVTVHRLAAALGNDVVTDESGALLAPDVFTLIVHPDSAGQWRDNRILDVVLKSLVTAGEEAGYHFSARPTITISIDDSIPLNDAKVLASHRIQSVTDTHASPVDNGLNEEPEGFKGNAFLIIEGVKVYSLSQPVVNIGRRLDNQLVIDDPRVSRNHAQLRIINGRYVVFDLNSTGGTFVNGQRTNQSVLYPGDVISLAGVALIFGQDSPLPHTGLKDTAPLPGGERPTAFIRDHTFPKIDKK